MDPELYVKRKNNVKEAIRVPEVIHERYGIQNSALIFHNYGNNVSSFVELTSPYMFLYEKISQATNQFTVMEFTQSNHFYVYTSYTELMNMETQSLHKHQFYEITYVLSGTLHMVIEGESYFFETNSGCICNKNIRHVEYHDSDCEFLLIMMQEDFLKELLMGENEGLPEEQVTNLHPLFNNLIDISDTKKYANEITKEFIAVRKKPLLETEESFPVFDKFSDFSKNRTFSDHMLSLINSMLETVTSHRPGWSYMMRYLLCQFLSCFEDSELYEPQHHHMKVSILEDLFIKVSLLIDGCHGNLSRTDLEYRLGYNGDYLTRIIRQYTGMNFVEYAQSFSMKEAEHLLSETDKSIGDICLSLGYVNRTHFNNIFKKKYGLSPKEYRQMCQRQIL